MACCSCLCKGLAALGVPAKAFPKVAYLISDLLFMLIAVLLMYSFKPMFEEFDWMECNDASGGGDSCFGTSAVLRASFILFLYHLFILLCLCPRGHCSSVIHDGFFTGKFILILGGYIGTFWIHNDFFAGWAEFCRVGSIFYLIFQAYFLLNFAYIWNDKLVAAMVSTEACYAKFLLCGFSIILAVICSVWLGFQFVWYSGCVLGNMVVGASCVFLVFFYIVSLLPLCDV